MPDGTRVRKNFKDKADAIRELADLELEIEENPEPRKPLRTLLTAQQLADAESAHQQVKHGKPLSQVVADYRNLEDRVAAMGANLEQAVSFFESRYRPDTTTISILNARQKYLDSRVGIATTTRANYEIGLNLLLKPDPNKHLHSFTLADIEAILGTYKSVGTKRSYKIIITAFFNWAVRQHYCLENPCDRLDRLPRDMSQIAALTLEESKRLLHAAMLLHDGAAAATVAIGLFAGLRPSEIEDLKPSDIGRGRIRVAGGKMRRKLKRSVPISPVLSEWLKQFPFTGHPTGWKGKLKLLKKATKAHQWVQDVIRHTSISFQADRDKNEALTAYNCGTSIQMMDRHYRHSIDDEKTVQAFWALNPEAILAEPPEVELPKKKGIEWPTNAEVKKLVWSKPLTHAAADLGVSDVALGKHCRKAGIELPPRGHWQKG